MRSDTALSSGVSVITYAATITPVATASNHFRCVLTGNVTLNAPTGGLDGQKITIELVQDSSGGRSLALGTGIGVGSDLTTVSLSTNPNVRDYIALIYNGSSSLWHVVGILRGYS